MANKCTQCGGPRRGDNPPTTVHDPFYIGTDGVCLDCHLVETEGKLWPAKKTSGTRDLPLNADEIKQMRKLERRMGLDDDLSGGCFVTIWGTKG